MRSCVLQPWLTCTRLADQLAQVLERASVLASELELDSMQSLWMLRLESVLWQPEW